jgi:LysM repeat protein
LGVALLIGAFAMTVSAERAPRPAVNAPNTDWGGCRYWVRPGDTLFRIGVRYGVSWWYLAQINGLYNPNMIYVGMPLEVPCDKYPPKYPTRPAPPPCNERTTYLVKPGDNLFRISLMFGTTVNALRDANNLWGRVLRSGMTLIIPCPGNLPKVNGEQPPPPPPQEPTQGAAPAGTPAAPPPPEATPVPPPPEATAMPQAQPTQGAPAPEPTQAAPQPTSEGELLPEPAAVIKMGDNLIDPSAANIKVGESVVWVNESTHNYTVVSGAPGAPNNYFTSPELPPGGTFVVKFDAAGNYSYFISENPTLTGQVNVAP